MNRDQRLALKQLLMRHEGVRGDWGRQIAVVLHTPWRKNVFQAWRAWPQHLFLAPSVVFDCWSPHSIHQFYCISLLCTKIPSGERERERELTRWAPYLAVFNCFHECYSTIMRCQRTHTVIIAPDIFNCFKTFHETGSEDGVTSGDGLHRLRWSGKHKL